MRQVLWLSGPLVLRDVVAGILGVLTAIVAFLAGCAFASAGNFVWFAFLGASGVVSLSSSLPQLQRVHGLLTAADHVDNGDVQFPSAA